MGTAFRYSDFWPLPAGGMRIADHYAGDLDGKTVTVLEGGSVEGRVGAERIVIHGVVRGIVKAGSIAISKTARIEGELRYETLSIEPGARVEARLVPA